MVGDIQTLIQCSLLWPDNQWQGVEDRTPHCLWLSGAEVLSCSLLCSGKYGPMDIKNIIQSKLTKDGAQSWSVRSTKQKPNHSGHQSLPNKFLVYASWNFFSHLNATVFFIFLIFESFPFLPNLVIFFLFPSLEASWTASIIYYTWNKHKYIIPINSLIVFDVLIVLSRFLGPVNHHKLRKGMQEQHI